MRLMTLIVMTATLGTAYAHHPIQKDFAEISTRIVPADDLQELNMKRSEAQQAEVEFLESEDETTVKFKQKARGSLLNKKGGIYIVDCFYNYSGSQHIAAFFSPDGRIVELEDESQWLVVVRDVPKAAKWLSNDPITIYPNKDFFFKATNYKLTNVALNDTVDVDLIRGPKMNSIYTKYVTAIDLFCDAIYLNDGTRWDVSWADSTLTRHWMPNDVVIVGDNYGWYSGTYPYILINVSLNQYVCAQRGF